MACHGVQPWSLGGLIGAFMELAIAYVLLCVSTFVFFASKILLIFRVCLPCPCNGILGYRNQNVCLHKLLVDGPVEKIRVVVMLVRSKFPFDVVWSEDQRCNSNWKLIRDVSFCGNGVPELEGEDVCCSPFSSPRLQSMVDRESGYDAKGKRIMILKKRTGIRRPRRASLEYGKSLSALPNDSSRLVARVYPFPCDERDAREISGESSTPIAGREDGHQDQVKAPIRDDMAEIMCQSSELSGSSGESKGVDVDTQEKAPIIGDETDKIKMLQEALEKEKAAGAAIYLELEKERAAAATAADEAMGMISRLQKEKASIEMEVRQYQRMIEEKFVYDEEEMDVLKEILLRREKENHLLEKEVEAYRQMSFLENEKSNGDFNDMSRELGKRPSPSLDSNTDALLMLQQTADIKSNSMQSGNTPGSTEYEVSFVEKQIHPQGHSLEKCGLSSGKEQVHTDNVMHRGMTTEASWANIGIEKSLYCDGEEQQPDGDLKRNLNSSFLDTEPDVHDVHVIDGKTELWKEESRSSIYDALKGSQDFSPTFRDYGVRSGELLQDFPSTSQVDTEPKINTSSLDMYCRLPKLDNSRCKTLVIDLTKNSVSAVNSERLKIDAEVEVLIERLHMLEERKEKLTSSSEHDERQKGPSKLLEEIGNLLCKIQQLPSIF